MKTEQFHKERIAAYLSGDLTSEENTLVEQWINLSPENKKVFQEYSIIWKSSNIKLKNTIDNTEQDWLALKFHLEKEDQRAKFFFLYANNIVLKIAASIILLAGLGYAFLWRPAVPPIITTTAPTTTITSGNKVALVYLPDSTSIWLNVNSKLTYTKEFNHKNREVTLEGEGLFDVTHKSNNAFIVHTKNAHVRVLGTSFNIKEDSINTTVSVIRGTVSFSSHENDSEHNVVVKAKEKAVCTPNGNIDKSNNYDPAVTSWIKENNLIFETEKQKPTAYLSTKYTWRKNIINQTVIEGTVKNSARIAGYKNIVLKVNYTKSNGKVSTIIIPIHETVQSGKTIRFQKRLMDILTNTKTLTVDVKSAQGE